jgi:hypothetical protein
MISTSRPIPLLFTAENHPICTITVTLLSRNTSEYCVTFHSVNPSTSDIRFECATNLERHEKDDLVLRISALLDHDRPLEFSDFQSRISLRITAPQPLQCEFASALHVRDISRYANVNLSISNAVSNREVLSELRRVLISM